MYFSVQLANRQYSLPKILTLQHAQESILRVVDAVRDALLGNERALRYPFRNVLLVLSSILGAHSWIADNEALHLEALPNNFENILDTVPLVRGCDVVLRDHSARH